MSQKKTPLNCTENHNICVSSLTQGFVGREGGQGVVVDNGGRERADSLRLRPFLLPPRFTGRYRDRQTVANKVKALVDIDDMTSIYTLLLHCWF